MISILASVFIKDYEDSSIRFRQGYATLCSVVSILFNSLLFAGKLMAGTISGSIALIADALNNLSDAGTCILELLGFHIAGIGAGKKHPYGHGRIEWLMGLFAAVVVLFMGFEMMKSSINAIAQPQPIEVSWLVLSILMISIAAKLYMFFYNRTVGEKINSITMKAKAYDCIGDIAATTAVLISTIIIALTGLQIDGWCGIIVSAFILYAGFQALNETVSPIIGNAPDKELIQQIEQMAKTYPEIIEVNDIMVHDYGFNRMAVSCRLRGNLNGDSKQLIQIADEISYYLFVEFACEASIQVELIDSDPSLCEDMSLLVAKTVQNIDAAIDVNQIRITQHTISLCVYIELYMPIKLTKKEGEIKRLLADAIKEIDKRCILQLKTQVYTFKNKHKN